MVPSRFLSRILHQTPHPPRETGQSATLGSSSPQSSTAPIITPTIPPPINPVAYSSRAVLESTGIDDSTCETYGGLDNPKFLPVLPSDYQPFHCTVRDNNGASVKILPQSESPFFSRFPLEVRQLIYLYAFGDRRIHLDFNFQTVDKRWMWWHRVCDDAQHCPDKDLICPENADAERTMFQLGSMAWVKPGFQYKIGALGWLMCCKIGYIDSIPILYNSNTFVLTHGIDQLFRISRAMAGGYLALITSLHVEVDIYKASKGPPSMEPTFEVYYNGLFDIFRRCLPNVRDLVFSIAGLPNRAGRLVVWSDESEWLWVGPWEELAQSRDWKRLEIVLPIGWLPEFEALVDRRSRLGGNKRYRLVQGADNYTRGW